MKLKCNEEHKAGGGNLKHSILGISSDIIPNTTNYNRTFSVIFLKEENWGEKKPQLLERILVGLLVVLKLMKAWETEYLVQRQIILRLQIF